MSKLIARAAKERGLKVSSAELNAEIDKQIQQTIDAERGTTSERDWKYKLFQQGSSEEEYPR